MNNNSQLTHTIEQSINELSKRFKGSEIDEQIVIDSFIHTN